jgi:sulfite reductase (NADPH) flavoprotein alpha-component
MPLDTMMGFKEHQWSFSALIVLCFCLFTFWMRSLHQQKKLTTTSTLHTQTEDTMYVVYASQTGFAEEIALHTLQSLQQAQVPTSMLCISQVDQNFLQSAKRILFIVSTTGEGDAPDSAAHFTQNIMSQTLSTDNSLSNLSYAVLALGDSHYQQFCAFGHQLDNWLSHQQARSLFDAVEVDNADEGALRHWQHHLGVVTGHTELADWSTPEYQAWQLTERHLLNPNSVGNPVYHIVLQSLDSNISWQAGDILEVLPKAPHANSTTENSPLPHREYSIASIPNKNKQKIELVVRQMHQADGSLGIGSGWLTHYATIGEQIDCRIRINRSFHAALEDTPFIFIGNGTGIAGLRAHILQRAQAKQHQNWLIFGERNQIHDFLFQTEIEHWQQLGVLQRVDCAFSRDQEERIYVQHKLQQHAQEMKTWIEQGAAIFVCGSLQGMASDVHQALINIVGEEKLAQMKMLGSYKRDVY